MTPLPPPTPLPKDFLLSVVMPVYNEQGTIREIVARVKAAPFKKEIVLIDDCSRDGTGKVLDEMVAEDKELRLFKHAVNQGKGAALRTGFAQVKGHVVLIQDADLEYTPEDYPKLL